MTENTLNTQYKLIMTDEKGNTIQVSPETYQAMQDTEAGNVIIATDIDNLFKKLEE